MSGKLKEVRNRISSVKSTQQITKAMKMVSAAKLRRAQDKIVQMRPYADKLKEMLQNMSTSQSGNYSIAYANEREIEKVSLIVISSDRGLCGNFNSTIIKKTITTIEEKYKKQYEAGNLELVCIGNKACEALERRDYVVNKTYVNLFHHFSFEEVVKVANYIKQKFLAEEVDQVELIYAQFKNAAMRDIQLEQYLPIEKPEQTEDLQLGTDFIFEPDQEYIVNQLIPKILNTQFYKALLDSNASEHGARMTAMDNATENANELLKDLKISYNKVRQEAITTELSEIVGGAAALENV